VTSPCRSGLLDVEPQPWPRPIPKLYRAELLGVLVHSRSADAKQPRECHGVDQRRRRVGALVEHLDHPPRDRLDEPLRIDQDRRHGRLRLSDHVTTRFHTT
jgi:hypothetical protein